MKYFGKHRVVDSVSLSVPEGAIYGVLGPNGAGKTTTLRMLLGIIEPDAGSRTLLGRDRPIDAAYQIGYLPEERGLYPAMTTREAVAFLGSLRGLPLSESRRRADRMLEANGMGEVARRPIRTLSKGMAQTVQLLGTFIHQPKLIVLDEPFSGLDPLNQQGLEELIRAERQRGATILFSTHVMALVRQHHKADGGGKPPYCDSDDGRAEHCEKLAGEHGGHGCCGGQHLDHLVALFLYEVGEQHPGEHQGEDE